MVSIELFGGILPATAALKKSGLSFVSYFSEIASDPIEVASAHWPEAIPLGDVRMLDLERLDKIVAEYPEALFWLTGGVPCNDVSQLNKHRTGATGKHSGLHSIVRKIRERLLQLTKNVVCTFECTRMDHADKDMFSESLGGEPIEINNRNWCPLSRPRWWWITGKRPVWPEDTQFGFIHGIHTVKPRSPPVPWEECILPGYSPCSLVEAAGKVCFKCLTTRTPKASQPIDAAGIGEASPEALVRWAADKWSQAPYQYESANMVQDHVGQKRRLLPCEEEALMGYPVDYTAVLKKSQGDKHQEHAYRRQTLLGNSWSLHVTLFLVQVLIVPYVEAEVMTGDSTLAHIDEASFEWGRLNCPYLHDLEERGVPSSRSLPPDEYEMNAHSFGGLAEKIQSRKHTPWHLNRNTFGAGPVASLPKGLPAEVHFKAGSLADSPVDAPQQVPDDLDFAIRKTLTLGGKADAWRRHQLNALKSWVANAVDLEDLWNFFKSDNAKEVSPKVNPHVLDLLSHSIKWPDITIPAMMAAGALPLGKQEKTGVFRQRATSASLSQESFADGSSDFMDSLMSRSPPKGDQANIIFELSTKEQELGLLSPWRTAEYLDAKYGKGKWRSLPRYAIQQGDKWRLIDNGKAAEHNSTYSADETIHTTCTSAGVSVAARFRDLMGTQMKGKLCLHISTQDMWKAYRQIPCHEDQIQYMTVMVWHPDKKEWMFGESKGLLFGLTGAVLAFNRVPALIVAIARRWLAIPVQNFFDDFRIMDIAKSNGSANRFFCLLTQEVLGFRVDSAKEQKPDCRAIFLGNLEIYKMDDASDAMMVAPKPGRAKAISEEIDKILQLCKLTPGDAKSIRGRIIHYASTCSGRLGKGILFFINQQASADKAAWSEEIRFNLLFLQQLLTIEAPRIIPLAPVRPRRTRVWTDASFHVDSSDTPVCKLCGIISSEGHAPKGFVSAVPASLMLAFKERKQQIHMGEMLAPFCVLLQYGDLLRDTSSIFYIDNMGVLCNIVNGAARELDAGTVTFALHLRLAELKASVWWEWVESESNCSDGGSRVGITCPVASGLGITLEEIPFPPIPLEFMRMSPLEWARFWKEESL